MTRDFVRKHITLEDKKQDQYLEKFTKDAGFGSFSQMSRYVMMEASKKFYKGNHASAEIEQIQNFMGNSHHSLHSVLELIKLKLETIDIRIKKEGLTSNVPKAMKDILLLLEKKDSDHSKIVCELRKYGEKVVDTAICLLQDADLLGWKSKNIDKKEVKNNEKI